jgi:AcrR family transcriptional regulator
MTTRRYARPAGTPDTVERVLEAAEASVRAGGFHTVTMEELASQAGVSRATLFSRFGSRLGVLEALSVRCDGSPEIQALGDALAIEDPVDSLEALLDASCRVWEQWGGVQRHLRALVVLEPEVRPLIEAQRTFQRDSLLVLARRLAKDSALVEGISPQRAAAVLHLLTGLETFVELREDAGLTLRDTIETIRRLVTAVVKL